WPILATTASELHGNGALAPIWHRLDVEEPSRRLIDLPGRDDMPNVEPAAALGRRWRQDAPGFWDRLSPLGRVPAALPPVDLRLSAIDGFMDDPQADEEG
ncbi:MAG: hypothetical protein ACRDLR_04130, partial [Gaiellaceae bacterium]